MSVGQSEKVQGQDRLEATVNTDLFAGEYRVRFLLTAGQQNDNTSAPEVLAAFQDLINVINASDQFNITSGSHYETYRSSVTPDDPMS
ncbi:hypothetical protein phiRKBJ001_29 [Streptomyces phage phiRKBJ001]|nr:hypothetical protein phiRKBJ001_29 [Streptomyces phage phiRKBJ001]